jgi:hypothetical protein
VLISVWLSARFNGLTIQRITRRYPVLELGSVSLPVVTAWIDRFITEAGKGPYPDMGVSRSRVRGAVAAATWVRRLAETNFLSADCDLDCNFIGAS